MAKSLGVVSKVVGQVFAVGQDGTRRVLVEGDRLYAGEQLETGAAGAVAVHLDNGGELTLGRDSSLELRPELLAHPAEHVQGPEAIAPSEADLSDVERLQQAIAAGADPSQEAEATAAGPSSTGAPGAVGGGHSFVLLTEVAGRVDPVIGFPTAGFNGIPEFTIPDAGDTRFDDDRRPVTDGPDDPDNPVTLHGLDVAGGELTLQEAHLPHGSASNPGALTQGGSFTVSAPDGVFNLNVGGINVVTGGVVTGVGQSLTTALGNVLTITGYDPVTGTVSYSYTLATAGGAQAVSEQLSVHVSDTNGSVASGTLDIRIVDDAPKALDDSNPTVATEQQTTLTGNVLSNDVQGADRVPSGPITAGTYVGTYGTLVLAADGSYTYTLNTNDPDFINLHGGGSGVEHFTYTLTDADGDSSTATLVLNVTNLNDPVTLDGLAVKGGELTVHEKHLADGSAPDASALTQSGTFTVTAADGLQTLVVGGITLVNGGVVAGFPQSITTPLGNTLTVTGYNPATGVVSYSYTLTDNEAHPNADGTNSVSESFTVVATDSDGSSASGSIDVNIVDDAPKALDDSNPTVATEQQTTLTGNVLSNDVQGADRVPSGPITAGTYVGTYGTLVLAADGSYTYTLNTNDPDFINLHGGGSGVEHFTYTLTDADGDSSTATLVLNVTNLNDPVTLDGLAVKGGELTVHEKHLADGSAPDASALTQSGTFTVTAADGLQTLVVGGITLVNGGVVAGFPQSITTPLGNTLTVTGYNPATGVVSYSYTLTDNEAHPNVDGANSVSESFTVVATDSDGSSASGSIDVNIVDDVPQANPDTKSIVHEGGVVTGNVLHNDVVGADGAPEGKAVVGVRAGSDTSTPVHGDVGTQIMGTYGYLILNADGSATYHANPNSVAGAGATDTFVYTIRDADGDESTTTVTIKVLDSGLSVSGADRDVTVYEKALDLNQDGKDLAAGNVTGSDPTSTGETGTGTLVGAVQGGLGALTYTLVGNAVGQYGQIHLNGDGTYTYTLTSAPKTPGGANDGSNTLTETFTYQAKDQLGNTITSQIVINIVDDVPKANADSANVRVGDTVSGDVLYNDVLGADKVIDGNVVVGVRAGSDTSTSAHGDVGTQVMGNYGYLVINANGWATYHANPNSVAGAGATDTFVYTIRDADGDESTTTVTLNVQGNPLSVIGPDRDVTVYEKALDLNQDGKDLAAGTVTGSDPTSTGETGTGTLVGAVQGGVGALTYTLVGNAVGQYGQIHLNGDGTYTYTLTSAPKTPGGVNDGPNTTTETFTYQAKDQQGNTITSQIVINIVDDVPQAIADAKSIVHEGGVVTGNVLYNDDLGADKVTNGNVVVGVRAGSDTSTAAHGEVGTQIMGNYGYLILKADGSASYHANPNSVGSDGATDTFVYTIRDADGDESTTTVSIKVQDSQPWIGEPQVTNAPPVAGADHLITNIAGTGMTVPAEALLANDNDPDYDKLSVSSTYFDTRFSPNGAGFGVGSDTPVADFTGTGSNLSNRVRDLARSEFRGPADSMAAALIVSGFLASPNGNFANAQDVLTVTLKKGETLNLHHDVSASQVAMAWKDESGSYQAIDNDKGFTASHDGTYSIHMINLSSGNGSHGNVNYLLTMSIDYSNAEQDAYNGTYTVSDGHGGSATGNADITYQDGSVLTGTADNDTLVAGAGNDTLHGAAGNDVLVGGGGDDKLYGGEGNDLLIGGPGNDLLDGGAGTDTASYASAPGAVTVNLNLTGAQDTGGAGIDTLNGIDNLIGSDYNDLLIGNSGNNVLIGGLGNDRLTGGGGNDTFVWQKGDVGHDTVTDFIPGSDRLDLSQLLQGEHATSASLDDYLHFKVTGTGTNVVSTIEVSSVAGAAPTQTIELAGVDLAQHYGVTAGAGGVIASGQDTATIINGMLNDHSLKVDTV
ncbi:retention module-containing protein [Pseudomonas guariconensis]|uniref:retention module-containing protein n=3 Tax=Pseudomonas guariconensis TaxID=1288410 RepID=UPI003905C11B